MHEWEKERKSTVPAHPFYKLIWSIFTTHFPYVYDIYYDWASYFYISTFDTDAGWWRIDDTNQTMQFIMSVVVVVSVGVTLTEMMRYICMCVPCAMYLCVFCLGQTYNLSFQEAFYGICFVLSIASIDGLIHYTSCQTLYSVVVQFFHQLWMNFNLGDGPCRVVVCLLCFIHKKILCVKFWESNVASIKMWTCRAMQLHWESIKVCILVSAARCARLLATKLNSRHQKHKLNYFIQHCSYDQI